MIERQLFERSEHNPLLSPHDIPSPCDRVCNPAAILVDGEFPTGTTVQGDTIRLYSDTILFPFPPTPKG